MNEHSPANTLETRTASGACMCESCRTYTPPATWPRLVTWQVGSWWQGVSERDCYVPLGNNPSPAALAFDEPNRQKGDA